MEPFIKLNGRPGTLQDIVTRKEYVKRIIVKHSNYAEVQRKIAYCHQLSKSSVRPDNIFIYGDTGVGKSTLLEEYELKFQRVIKETYTKVPILLAKVPVGATPKSVASTLLHKLGDPCFDKGTEINMTMRLYKFIEFCEVEMIILDEFQHLIDSDTQHVLRRASDWVKTFTEEVKVPVILCGMPKSEDIFARNTQLDRRFCDRYELTAFKYETKEERIEFRGFLKNVDKQMPFPEVSGIAETQISDKLFYASLGIPYYIMKILEQATVFAVENGSDFLHEDYLHLAYKNLKRSSRPFASNPFCKESFNWLHAIQEEERAAERMTKKLR